MRFKKGDRVRIKSLDWYNENKDEVGNIRYKRDGSAYPVFFSKYMSNFCGEILTIKSVFNHSYHMSETSSCEFWTDEMIEGLVEDTITTNEQLNEQLFVLSNISLEKEMEWNLPEGYIFKDENGNVINATKIVLEKKKKEYPKTYEECCQYLGCDDKIPLKIIGEFTKLINARNAYWKIAGEEMGLRGPWEPDHDYSSPPKYIISCYFGDIIKEKYCGQYNKPLSFPTEKMRDAFYENFKEEIEICKELL